MDSIKDTIQNQAQENQMNCIKTCDKHGEYNSIKTFLKCGRREIPVYTKCPKCEEFDESERKKNYNNQKIISFKLGLKSAGIPKRYINWRINEIIPKHIEQEKIINRCIKYVDNFKALRKLGTSLIFTGQPGTGKTMIALSMVNDLVKAIYKEHFEKKNNIKDFKSEDSNKPVRIDACIYINVYDFFSQVRETFHKNSKKTEKDILNKFFNVELLILDEIGSQGGTDFETNMLFRIINMRYAELKPTFLISNLIEEDLKNYIGDRTVDRFHENKGSVFTFNWESHRRE